MLGEKHRDTHKPQQPGSLLQTQGDLTGAQTGMRAACSTRPSGCCALASVLCKSAPISDTGRCQMHGGKSLSGIAHPNYKHGRYSKVWIARFVGEMYYRDD
jgi:hypothetical protein